MHFTFIHLIWRNPSSSFIASNATVAVTRVHQEKKLSSLWSNTCVCNVLYTDSKGGVKYAEAKAETLGEIMQIVTDPSAIPLPWSLCHEIRKFEPGDGNLSWCDSDSGT